MTSTPSQFGIAQTLPLSKITRPVGAPGNKFNNFNLDYSKILTDNYPHKKLLTVKYSGKGLFFTVNGKGTVDLKTGADKKEHLVTASEVKIITNVEGRNVEAKFDNKGSIRFWGNFGTYTIGRPVILTAKWKTDSLFSRHSGNLCLEYQSPQANIWTRLDLKDGAVPFFNEKMIFRMDKIQLGYAAKINLLAHSLARYNMFVSYTERDFSVVAEHMSRNKTKVELGKLILAATYRRAGNDYIAKVSYRPHKVDQLRFKVGTVANINPDTTLRAKINNNTKLTLSSRLRYNSNLTIVAGSQVNLLEPASFLTKKTIPVPLGFSVEFAY